MAKQLMGRAMEVDAERAETIVFVKHDLAAVNYDY